MHVAAVDHEFVPRTRGKGAVMKYGVAWLLGVPVSLIALWFVVNQMGCGF
jgi:hypothetical protein